MESVFNNRLLTFIFLCMLPFVWGGCRKQIVEKYPNGKAKEIRYEKFFFSNGLPDGPSKVFYLNGNCMVDRYFRNGRLHGLLKTYYPDGKKNTIQVMDNDLKYGPDTMWYKNGELKYAANYKCDKLDGKYQEWDSTGKLIVLTNYKEGLENGIRYVWYKSGEKSEESFKNGLRSGSCKIWYNNGKLKEEGFFLLGNPCGSSYAYDSIGAIKEKLVQSIRCDTNSK
jgi:antitoxin component YwqK of YwqJK toxin-antitoxin module